MFENLHVHLETMDSMCLCKPACGSCFLSLNSESKSKDLPGCGYACRGRLFFGSRHEKAVLSALASIQCKLLQWWLLSSWPCTAFVHFCADMYVIEHHSSNTAIDSFFKNSGFFLWMLLCMYKQSVEHAFTKHASSLEAAPNVCGSQLGGLFQKLHHWCLSETEFLWLLTSEDAQSQIFRCMTKH